MLSGGNRTRKFCQRGRRLRKESKTLSTHTWAGSGGPGGWRGAGVVGVMCPPCSSVRKRQQMRGGIFYQKTQSPSPGLASASLGAAFPATRSPAPLQNSSSTRPCGTRTGAPHRRIPKGPQKTGKSKTLNMYKYLQTNKADRRRNANIRLFK